MGTKNIEKKLKKHIKRKTEILSKKIREIADDLTFTMLEVGARKTSEHAEPFYQFLNNFPGSRIIAFEVDSEICHQLNANAPSGVTYYPVALTR